MQLTRDTLKPFQLRAGGELSQKLATYPNPPYKAKFDEYTREPLPFLCRLRAITGSGKTPMLALCAADLGDAIILWTTNRGAVISQTVTNLSAGGSYSTLLPEDAQVLDMAKMQPMDWTDVCTAETGLSILLATEALFNRDGDVLNVHKERGDTSYWQMLSGEGSEGRRRPLYVIYDEAHGGTSAQFTRLTELRPRAFILASASELPDGLSDLLPGRTSSEKTDALQLQTVVVPTKEVVEAGLLKTRLYLVDCNTTRLDALKEANDKWFTLIEKLKPTKQWPVMCCIVNSTLAGLEVWDMLTQTLGVDPNRVAVHLANVGVNLAAANPNAPWTQLIDTHKAKKTPEALRNEGYTHLIWNLSLREGWDEPWAYVAYLDGSGKSLVDISQKIGRFLRQPNAAPFDDGDLNSAYFYFNVPDDDFAAVVRSTQRELANEGYEVISISGGTARPKSSRESPVKKAKKIDKVAESFGVDLDKLDQILIKNVPLFDSPELKAPGRVTTRVIDMRRSKEDGSLYKEERRDDNAEISVWNYLMARLANIDKRVLGRFSSDVKETPRMKQKMQMGSSAMNTLNTSLLTIVKQLNDEFLLEYEYDSKYELKPFNLVSPDLQTDDELKRERYRVRTFANALHEEYNGLNPFEVKLAEALDTLGLDWCRNPSKTGYGIPIPEVGEGTTNFFPDFLLWSGKCLWAIDPKGAHLLNDAIRTKLMGVSDVDDMPLKIRVAFVVEGKWELGVENRPKQVSKDGCTLILKQSTGPRAKPFNFIADLVKEFK